MRVFPNFLLVLLLTSSVVTAAGNVISTGLSRSLNGESVLPAPTSELRPPAPSRTSIHLERWGRGWRIHSREVPLVLTEPGGATALVGATVPRGRNTSQGSDMELYLADLASGLVRPVAAPGIVHRASWSPGGRWYAFHAASPPDGGGIWVWDARSGTLVRVIRDSDWEFRWLKNGVLAHNVLDQTGFHTVLVDLQRGFRGELARDEETFRGQFAGNRSIVIRGTKRAVHIRPIQPMAQISSPPLPPARVEDSAPGTVQVSPRDAFVNTVVVAESGRRLVYAFTRTQGTPGGANTLYVDTLGILTDDGRSWEIGLGFRGDLRDGHLTLSPGGRYLFVDYHNHTDQPAQGYHMYDLDERRRLWYISPRHASLSLLGWEVDDAVLIRCPGVGPGCLVWKVTPEGRWSPWVGGVERLLVAGGGWAWKDAGAWWFKALGKPVRRLSFHDLPSGISDTHPPSFDPESNFAQVQVPKEASVYLLPTIPK